MFENKTSEKGKITYADEVVASIAGIAAVGISGVAGMSGGLVNGITEFLGKKSPMKGVKVEADNGDVVVNLQVVAEYGISMPEICDKMQDNIKKDIERMTGLKVKAVNVNVQGIRIKDEAAEKEPADK
jgi:uncharacterized alkaline shock family protein YloU